MSTQEEMRDAAAAGKFTSAELIEQELTGEQSLPLLLQIIADYRPIIDTQCDNHRTTLIAAVRLALENGTSVGEIRSCLDTKLIDFAGCVACILAKQ